MTALCTDTDFALLDRFNGGDQQAFAEIVRRYAGLVYSVCKRVVRDNALAEDVAQETFFRLVQRHKGINSSLAGWLHRSAARLALDALRSESARRRREAAIAAENESTTLPDTILDERNCEIRWADFSPVIDVALAELPDEARAILIQHFLQGTSQLNLAAEHDVSPATMSRRIRSALDQLRASLMKRGHSVPAAALSPMLLFAGTSGSAATASVLGALGKMAMAHAAGGTFGLGPILRTAAAARPANPPVPFVTRGSCVRSAARPAVPALTIVAAVALALVLAVPSIWIEFNLKAASFEKEDQSVVEYHPPADAGRSSSR